MSKGQNNGAKPVLDEGSLPISEIYALNGNPIDDTIEFTYVGKAKTIVTGTGDTIGIFPGERGTFTNIDTGESIDVMLNGSWRIEPFDDGTSRQTFNGNSVLGDPVIGQDGQFAIVQTRGHFNYVFDTVTEDVVVPLNGQGQINYVVDDLLS